MKIDARLGIGLRSLAVQQTDDTDRPIVTQIAVSVDRKNDLYILRIAFSRTITWFR
jgi:hypothetical protein